MRLATVLEKLRYELSDPTTSTNKDWSDPELSGIISDQVHIMVRRQVALDEAYHNHRFDLLAASATQRAADVWAYRLPHWVSKIIEVRYKQDSDMDPRKRVIPRVDRMGGRGWRYSGRREFELTRIAMPEDITLAVAKRPARLTKGRLPPQTGMLANQIRIDADTSADAQNYTHEGIEDAYVNAVIELTGPNSTTRAPGGQVRTVTRSEHYQVDGLEIYTVLTVDSDWTVAPATADLYEMHPEIDDEHLRLLILLCARSAWTRKGNADEVRASEAELHQEWSEFVNGIQPRDLAAPKIIKPWLSDDVTASMRHGDNDSDFWWG